AVVLVLVHVVATAWGYALSEDGSVPGELGTMIADLPGMVAATIGTVLLVLVAVTCAQAARRRLRYGVWWLIHLTAYVAVVPGVADAGGGVSVWLEGDGAARRDARGGGFVLVRFLARGLWSAARPYTITELGEGDRLRVVIRRRPALAARLARLRPGTRAIV